MNRKLVYRYFCDFCKKANCSAPSITKHERGCTANPDRICGMCKAIEHEQVPLVDIIAALRRDIDKAPITSQWGDCECTPTLAFEAADGCPACTLAAIRQTKAAGVQFNFDFQAAKERFWAAHNEPLAGRA